MTPTFVFYCCDISQNSHQFRWNVSTWDILKYLQTQTLRELNLYTVT